MIALGGRELIPGGYEALAPSAAIGFSSSYLAQSSGAFAGRYAQAALVMVETRDCRYTLDGVTTPTNAIGMLVAAGDYIPILISGQMALANFRIIETAASASVKVTYFY